MTTTVEPVLPIGPVTSVDLSPTAMAVPSSPP